MVTKESTILLSCPPDENTAICALGLGPNCGKIFHRTANSATYAFGQICASLWICFGSTLAVYAKSPKHSFMEPFPPIYQCKHAHTQYIVCIVSILISHVIEDKPNEEGQLLNKRDERVGNDDLFSVVVKSP